MQAWPEQARNYATLLHGVLGATMLGWGVGLWLLVRHLWGYAPRVVWRVAAVSLASWFVPDTVFSAAVAAWPNVGLNLAFAAPFVAALVLARRHL
jgi:hypothetical protein